MLAIFAGSIVDKFGPKKSILFEILVMSFLMIFHRLPSSYEILLLLGFLIGLGASFITPSVSKGIIIAVSSKERAVSMEITQMGFGFGSIAGAILSHFAVFLSEDRNLSLVAAGLGLGILQFGVGLQARYLIVIVGSVFL